jgi:hypothetical protein
MIFCIGPKEAYLTLLEGGKGAWIPGRVKQSCGITFEGHVVFQKRWHARAYAGYNELYDVFGVAANWETDTHHLKGEPYRRLKERARLLLLHVRSE